MDNDTGKIIGIGRTIADAIESSKKGLSRLSPATDAHIIASKRGTSFISDSFWIHKEMDPIPKRISWEGGMVLNNR